MPITQQIVLISNNIASYFRSGFATRFGKCISLAFGTLLFSTSLHALLIIAPVELPGVLHTTRLLVFNGLSISDATFASIIYVITYTYIFARYGHERQTGQKQELTDFVTDLNTPNHNR